MNIVASIIYTILIYIIITILWQFAEKIFYGQVTPRLLDDVVAIILSISIYKNFN